MKEIIENSRYKFRAWVNNSFMGWVTEISTLNQYAIVTLDNDNDNDNNDTYCHGKSFRFSQIELMQYTGIKDRDGTEIFEGDILSVINGSINSKPWPQKNITVLLEKGGTNLPNWIRNEIWDSTHFVKVIGNIHENPELMK